MSEPDKKPASFDDLESMSRDLDKLVGHATQQMDRINDLFNGFGDRLGAIGGAKTSGSTPAPAADSAEKKPAAVQPPGPTRAP